MKRVNWRGKMILYLFALSIVFYCLHYFIFRDLHHIFIYILGDVAFLFIQVLFVTIILQRILEIREKNALLLKMNMVIGVFFSETGTELLSILATMSGTTTIDRTLITEDGWTKAKYLHTCQQVKQNNYTCSFSREELHNLKQFLGEKKDFLLRLLENPILLEHESFTELLWAVFHLAEELAARKDVMSLPNTDVEHLCNDTGRVYNALVLQWLYYMEHLREAYPFLFSYARRTNPFYPTSIEIIN